MLSLWVGQQLKGFVALLQWSDEWYILRMWGRFPVVLRLRVHVCHVAGGGYEWEEGVARWWLLQEPCVRWKWEGSGGGRNKELRKEEEDRSLYTTNRAPFPPLDSCSPNVGDIDPGGAVNDRVVWKVSSVSGAGEANLLIPQSPWISTVRTAEGNADSLPPPRPFLSHLQPVSLIDVITVCMYNCCSSIDINIQPHPQRKEGLLSGKQSSLDVLKDK